MNEAKILHAFLSDRQKAIFTLLKETHTTYTVEDFHKLRVEIKKLKAAASLLYFSSEPFNVSKFIGAYRKVFRRAGKIRELQLHRAYLLKFETVNALPRYRMNLLNDQHLEMSKFLQLKSMLNQPELQNNYKKALAVSQKIRVKHIFKGIVKEQEEITSLLKKKNMKVKQMHDLRKKVKSYYFLSSLFPNKTNKLKRLNAFQELLGKWHDYEVFVHKLNKDKDFYKLPLSEITRINKLELKVKSERDELFEAIVQMRINVLNT